MNNPGVENLEREPVVKLAAEKIMSNSAGRAIHFASIQRLTDPDRHIAIYRCFADPGSEGEATYIVKQMGGDANSGENREERWVRRFTNDWVRAEFLSSIPSDVPISPRFYGSDPKLGLFVMEDLGEHRSLVEPLLTGAGAGAEVALLRYSTCLGKLHAMTAGKAAAFETLFSARLPGSKPIANELKNLEACMKTVEQYLEQFGISTGGSFTAEIQAVMDAARYPGPFLVYIHSDPCPDNVFDLGDRMRLIDFETGHFGHALVDGIYPRMIFPTCWCCSRLPGEIVARVENRYRSELVLGCPEAQEDAVWETALAHLSALAMLLTLCSELEDSLKEDHEWGLATIRHRVLVRLEAFAATSMEFHRPLLAGSSQPAAADSAGALGRNPRAAVVSCLSSRAIESCRKDWPSQSRPATLP